MSLPITNLFRPPVMNNMNFMNIMNQINVLISQTESLYNEYKTTTDPTYKSSLGVIIATKKESISALVIQYNNSIQSRIDAMLISKI